MVYVWDKSAHAIECLHRTNHGKGWLNPDEMERHMMNGSRATKLAFMAARGKSKSRTSIEILGGVWRYYSSCDPKRVPQPRLIGEIKAEEDGWFEVEGTVAATNPPERLCVAIPFDLVRSVWVSSAGMLTVLLSVRLLYVDKGLTLEALGA